MKGERDNILLEICLRVAHRCFRDSVLSKALQFAVAVEVEDGDSYASKDSRVSGVLEGETVTFGEGGRQLRRTPRMS